MSGLSAIVRRLLKAATVMMLAVLAGFNLMALAEDTATGAKPAAGSSGGKEADKKDSKMNTGPKAQPKETIAPLEPSQPREAIKPRE